MGTTVGILALAIGLWATPANAQLRVATELVVPDEPVQLLYINVVDRYVPYAPNQWHTIDLTRVVGVPRETVAIGIQGIIGITHNIGQPATCHITAQFRKPGSTQTAGNYQLQATAHLDPDGVRNPVAMTQAVSGGLVEFYWTYTEVCPASFINLKIAAVYR